MRNSISAEALAVMGPKLAAIADYGMNMASFATKSWTSMSFEDQKRNCDEALDAIDAAGLGENLNAARSFVLARYGSALITNGAILEAVDKFKHSCLLNTLKRPDRHYNLACAYARVVGMAAIQVEKTQNENLALNELEKCFVLAVAGPISNTVSQAYFKSQAASDSDLDPIRSATRFAMIIA